MRGKTRIKSEPKQEIRLCPVTDWNSVMFCRIPFQTEISSPLAVSTLFLVIFLVQRNVIYFVHFSQNLNILKHSLDFWDVFPGKNPILKISNCKQCHSEWVCIEKSLGTWSDDSFVTYNNHRYHNIRVHIKTFHFKM